MRSAGIKKKNNKNKPVLEARLGGTALQKVITPGRRILNKRIYKSLFY